jgi:large repetitive protein
MVRASWLASFKGLLWRRKPQGWAASRPKASLRRMQPQERLEDRRLMAVDVLPDVAVDIVATAGDASVALTWTAPADNGAVIADYLAEYSTDEGMNWQPYDDGVSADPLMTVTGLANGTSYVFHIAAVNEYQQSGDWSSDSSAVTPAGLAGVPTDVVASRGDGSADLAWTVPLDDNGSAVTGYVVEYSNDGETWVSVPDSVTGSSTTVTGLVNGTSYIFHVAAVNGMGQGGFSDASAAVVPAGIPDAPSDVVAIRGDGFVDLSWNVPLSENGSAVTGYLVDYSLDDGENWIQAAGEDDPLTATALTLPALENGVAYVFRVAATNVVGPSAYSAWSDAVTPAGLPEAPLDVITTRGDAAVDLTWTVPGSNGSDITDYIVEYSIDDGFSWVTFDDGASAEASVTVAGLVADTSYRFQVSALNDVGQGAWSAPTTETSPLTAPGKVTSLVVDGGNGSARLAWSAPLDDGGRPVVEYVVEYRAVGAADWTVVPAESVSEDAATVTGLTNGVAYQFRVAARTAFATGDFPDNLSTVTPLPPPTRLQGRASSGTAPVGSATLSWVAPVTPVNLPVLDYVIQSSADSGLTWVTQSDAVSRATSSTVGGLTNGTTYLFRVAAVTANGQGAFSAPSTAMTPFLRAAAAAPAAPTGLVGVGGRGTVSLSWVAPNSNSGGPPVDYVIRLRLDVPGSRWFTYNRAASAIPAAILRRLSPGQAFVFQVAARNLSGVGAFSDSVSVRA